VKAVAAKLPPASRLANKAEVAEFFEIHIATLDAWIRRGCPYRQRGGRGVSWEFDLLDVAAWKYGGESADSGDDPEQMPPKERLDWYKGCRERDNHRREAGELLHVDEVTATWSKLIGTAKARLLALPQRLAPKLIKLDDLRKIEDATKKEIFAILEELADGK
jgi:phage terminase Nu1 subunit (DNA packaging protein)